MGIKEKFTAEKYAAEDLPQVMPPASTSNSFFQKKKEQPIKEVSKEEKDKLLTAKQAEAIQTTFDIMITGAVNTFYLSELPKEKQLTKEEVKSTEFSMQILNTLNYYFPDGKYENPLIGLIISAATLGMTIHSKKPIMREEKDVKKENNGTVGEINVERKSPSTTALKSS